MTTLLVGLPVCARILTPHTMHYWIINYFKGGNKLSLPKTSSWSKVIGHLRAQYDKYDRITVSWRPSDVISRTLIVQRDGSCHLTTSKRLHMDELSEGSSPDVQEAT